MKKETYCLVCRKYTKPYYILTLKQLEIDKIG